MDVWRGTAVLDTSRRRKWADKWHKRGLTGRAAAGGYIMASYGKLYYCRPGWDGIVGERGSPWKWALGGRELEGFETFHEDVSAL
jgi:hypothetical protein